MKLCYIKYLGLALAAGMTVGAVGASMLCCSRGMRATRRRAIGPVHAMGDPIHSVKHMLS